MVTKQMSYDISDDKFDLAYDLARQGKSVREIAAGAGIARETAHRIQKAYRQIRAEDGGPVPKRKGGYWDQKKRQK